MEIPNDIKSMNTGAGPLSGFVMEFGDATQIDASGDIDENGVTIGLGDLGDGEEPAAWGEIRISWNAVQAVADELNAMLRAARAEGWI